MINDVLKKYTNLSKKLPFDLEQKKRRKKSNNANHAFSKFFNTECAKAGVYPDFIEIMLGH